MPIAIFVVASLFLQEGSISIQPKPAVKATQTVHFKVSAEVGNRHADLSAKAILTVVKCDAVGAEYSIDWKDIDFSGDEQGGDLGFSPFNVKVGTDGNLTDVEGGTPVSDPARTVMITFFPKPPSALDLNKPLTFQLAPHEKGGIPGMKVTETYEGVDSLSTLSRADSVQILSAYKVLVKAEEVSSAGSEGFTLEATFWVNALGDVIKEDGKFINLPISGAGTNATGTIKASIANLQSLFLTGI